MPGKVRYQWISLGTILLGTNIESCYWSQTGTEEKNLNLNQNFSETKVPIPGMEGNSVTVEP